MGQTESRIDATERYSRQRDIIPIDRLAQSPVTIIGVGAIGRQVAIQLSAIGCPIIKIIDFDTVETGNLAAQGFLEADLGKSKVEAVENLCHDINTEVQLECRNGRFRRSDGRRTAGGVVFACVDTMDARKRIYEATREHCNLFVDGRMSAEVLRVLSVVRAQEGAQVVGNVDTYSDTLFTSEEAYTGSCTAKTTIYSSNVIAGIMVSQFTKYLRGIPVDTDIQFNLLTMEILVQ